MVDAFDYGELVTASLEVVGLILLFWEVWLGHKSEELNAEINPLAELTFLYTSKNYKGFYEACRLQQGDTPAGVQQQVAFLGSSAIERAVEDQWSTLGPKSAEAIYRYKTFTSKIVMRRRQYRLFLGTLLLIGAAIMKLLYHFLHL